MNEDFRILLEYVGELGLSELKEKLLELKEESSEPWKRAILELGIDAVSTFGSLGIQTATQALQRLLYGDGDLEQWMDLGTASDLLAHLQNAEANRKSEATEFMVRVGMILGELLIGLLRSIK